MKTAKVAKQRPVLVSALAAKVLGHSRSLGDKTITNQHVTATFPAFNALEIDFALSELVEKQLVTQKGYEERATYMLTERGRTTRVSVS